MYFKPLICFLLLPLFHLPTRAYLLKTFDEFEEQFDTTYYFANSTSTATSTTTFTTIPNKFTSPNDVFWAVSLSYPARTTKLILATALTVASPNDPKWAISLSVTFTNSPTNQFVPSPSDPSWDIDSQPTDVLWAVED